MFRVCDYKIYDDLVPELKTTNEIGGEREKERSRQ